MKRTLCILSTLILMCALLPAAGTAEAGLMVVRNDSQQFSTQIPEGHTYEENNNGQLNIWLDDPGYVPNIWMNRRKDKIAPEILLYQEYPGYMSDRYGERLKTSSTYEYLEFGGKKLPAVSFIYDDGNGNLIRQFNLMEVRDDGDVEYQVRYGEAYAEMALEALDTAVRYYRPDPAQGTGPSAGPAVTAVTKYEDDRFSVMLPEGWQILTSGSYMTFCFKAWDPSNPDRCFFMFMKLEPILKSEAARQAYEEMHKVASQYGDNTYLFYAMVSVMEKCDLASFLKIVPEGAEYCRYFASTGMVLNADVYPQMRNAEIIREANGFAVITAADDAGNKIEGLVTANPMEAIVPNYVNGVDISPYSVYGFTGITVPEGEPAAWRDALMACLCSFSFKPEYVYDAVDISNAEKEMLLAWGEQMAVMHEAMVKTWVGY